MPIFLILFFIALICAICGLLGRKSSSPYTETESRMSVGNGDDKWKNCPSCKHKVNVVAKKCPYCNAEFPQHTIKKTKTRKTTRHTKTKICPECGHELNEVAVFCGFCGYRF